MIVLMYARLVGKYHRLLCHVQHGGILVCAGEACLGVSRLQLLLRHLLGHLDVGNSGAAVADFRLLWVGCQRHVSGCRFFYRTSPRY